jgi:membrane protein
MSVSWIAQSVRSFVTVLQSAAVSWLDDRAPTLAGALAFSTIFALAPLIVIIMALLGHFISDDQIRQHLVNQASHSVGRSAGIALQDMVVSARANAGTSTIVGAVGWIALFGAASGIFLTLQDALNIIWHVRPKKDQRIIDVLRERGSALLMVFAMALLLVATFAADAAVSVAVTFVRDDPTIAAFGWLLQLISTIVSLVVATGVFALAFKMLPQRRTHWRDVLPGAIVSAVLLNLGQWLISLGLQVAGLNRGYGAAGSILALLMWIYVSAMFLLFGAEVAKTHAGIVAEEPVPFKDSIPHTA